MHPSSSEEHPNLHRRHCLPCLRPLLFCHTGHGRRAQAQIAFGPGWKLSLTLTRNPNVVVTSFDLLLTETWTCPYHNDRVALAGVWRCTSCGWIYPNPNPSLRNRREHKRHCGEITNVQRWLGAQDSLDTSEKGELLRSGNRER